LDNVAYNSHKRAAAATESGFFKTEIAPMEVKVKRDTVLLDYDEGIRADTTLETLGKLRPAFKKDGLLTAGTSSQISDGAAALIIASEAAVEKHNLKPIGRFVGGAWAAGDSWRFVEAPVPAVKKLVGKLDMDVNDFDLVENNEAFALNSVLFNKVLGIPYDKMNVHGGAIALGHPIGCTGARLIVTLLSGLAANGGKLGLASLCHGTGGGTAVAIERL
jgi:acetyl-CoA C-acetyltransferase